MGTTSLIVAHYRTSTTQLPPLQYGKVYRGIWKGVTVAVKSIVLPMNAMSGAEHNERMAIMEAAISSSLSHPNIVKVRFC